LGVGEEPASSNDQRGLRGRNRGRRGSCKKAGARLPVKQPWAWRSGGPSSCRKLKRTGGAKSTLRV